jgi:hypothetical protein
VDETSSVPEIAEPTQINCDPPQSIQPELSMKELQEELTAYGRTKPVPNWQETLPDIRWFQEHRYDPEIQKHRGDYIAILDGKVIGAGKNSLKLELDSSKKCHVHPARVIVEWVDDGRDLHVTLNDGLIELPLRDANAHNST